MLNLTCIRTFELHVIFENRRQTSVSFAFSSGEVLIQNMLRYRGFDIDGDCSLVENGEGSSPKRI